MNEGKMGIPQSEQPEAAVERESNPVPIEEWARQNNHDSLLNFIDSARETNANVGVFAENMMYDPSSKTMRLTVQMNESMHQGNRARDNKTEKDYVIMWGGMPKAFADVVSGALAFTEMEPTYIPLHTKIVEAEFPGVVVPHQVPVVITSTFELNAPEESAYIIKTVVTQGPNICFTEVCEVRATAERGCVIAARRSAKKLDDWLEEKSAESI